MASRATEWLLQIDFAKREIFAYACEAFSRICALGRSPADRRRLVAELEAAPTLVAAGMDGEEYVGILREAVLMRNGWKRILERCAPHRAPHGRDVG